MEQIENFLFAEESLDFPAVTKSELYDTFNYFEIPIPIQLEYDADWPNQYKECWRIKEMSASRTISDLVMQVLDKEFKRLEINLNQ